MKRIAGALLGLLCFAEIAEARPFLERIDHWLWGKGQALSQAYDAYDAGKFPEAEGAFRAFADSHADSQEQSYNAGVAAYKAGKPEDAVKYFGRAAAGSDPLLKAKALHNTAVIHIDKTELEPARDALKEALAFDNENRAIAENLAWVEEQLKKNPPEPKEDQKDKKDQDQKQAEDGKDKAKDQEQDKKDQGQGQDKDQKKDQDQKQADQSKENQSQSQEKKDQGQTDQEKKKEQDQKEAQGGQDKKDSAKDDKDKQQSAQSEESKDKDKKDKQDQAAAAQKQLEEGDPKPNEKNGDPTKQKAQAVLTPAEIKNQEAERLLRSIDDKIGRYPLIETEATGERGKDGKNW